MLGGEDIINTSDGCVVRRGFHQIGISLSLLGNFSHHSDETVERLPLLVLRGLDHQRLVE